MRRSVVKDAASGRWADSRFTGGRSPPKRDQTRLAIARHMTCITKTIEPKKKAQANLLFLTGKGARKEIDLGLKF